MMVMNMWCRGEWMLLSPQWRGNVVSCSQWVWTDPSPEALTMLNASSDLPLG